MDNFRIINIYTNIVMKGNNQGNVNVNYDLSSNDNRVYFAKPKIRPREEEDGPESYASFGDIKAFDKSRKERGAEEANLGLRSSVSLDGKAQSCIQILTSQVEMAEQEAAEAKIEAVKAKDKMLGLQAKVVRLESQLQQTNSKLTALTTIFKNWLTLSSDASKGDLARLKKSEEGIILSKLLTRDILQRAFLAETMKEDGL